MPGKIIAGICTIIVLALAACGPETPPPGTPAATPAASAGAIEWKCQEAGAAGGTFFQTFERWAGDVEEYSGGRLRIAAYPQDELLRLPDVLSGLDSDVVQMAVFNNASLAGTFFTEAPLGVLEPGAYADLIFVDYQPYTPLTAGNLPWHIIFGFHASMVTTTIVNGKVLMQDRKLTTLDEEVIFSSALDIAPGVWDRYWAQFR